VLDLTDSRKLVALRGEAPALAGRDLVEYPSDRRHVTDVSCAAPTAMGVSLTRSELCIIATSMGTWSRARAQSSDA
jgi:hypothetical protein